MIDLSILEARVKSLNDSLGTVGVLLAVSTFAVVVGLVVEYAEDFIEFGEAVRLAIRRRAVWPLSILDKKTKRAICGGILVVLGVGFELRYEWKMSSLEGELEGANDQIVTQLGDDATQLEARLKSATEAAIRAEDSSTEASDKADKANTSASRSLAVVLAADKAIAEQGEKIKTRGPRVVFLEEKSASIIKAITPFTGQRFDMIFCGPANSSDNEGKSTESYIEAMLTTAGWALNNRHFDEWTTMGCDGVKVWVNAKSPDSAHRAAVALNTELLRTLPHDLPLKTGTLQPFTITSEFADSLVNPKPLPNGMRVAPFSKESAYGVVGRDPETVAVEVGGNFLTIGHVLEIRK